MSPSQARLPGGEKPLGGSTHLVDRNQPHAILLASSTGRMKATAAIESLIEHLHRTTTRTHSRGLDGPNNATTGVPTAEAMCIAPLSLPTKRADFLAMAANCLIVVRPAMMMGLLLPSDESVARDRCLGSCLRSTPGNYTRT